MEPTQTIPKARRGRPKRGEGPNLPWPEIDRLLVHGEQVIDPKTGAERLTYPSLALLAERYGVSRTLLWKYANKHQCYERRKDAQARTQAQTDDKVIEKLSSARAAHTVDVLRVVDQFLLGFEEDLRKGKVRTDSAADFDRLTRLREFVTGGADSRQEIQGGISLAVIQARHQRLRAQVERVPGELTGVVDDAADELADTHRGEGGRTWRGPVTGRGPAESHQFRQVAVRGPRSLARLATRDPPLPRIRPAAFLAERPPRGLSRRPPRRSHPPRRSTPLRRRIAGRCTPPREPARTQARTSALRCTPPSPAHHHRPANSRPRWRARRARARSTPRRRSQPGCRRTPQRARARRHVGRAHQRPGAAAAAPHRSIARFRRRRGASQARGAVDVSTIVDDFVSGFRRALDEGRVRVDSPADLDRLVRLKELISGNADSRAEVQGTLTLEAIQVRHRQLRGQLEGMSPELAGTREHDAGDDEAAGGGERGDDPAE